MSNPSNPDTPGDVSDVGSTPMQWRSNGTGKHAGGSAFAQQVAAAERRPFRRLRLRQRVVPLLVALVLLSSAGIVTLAYFGARADATTAAMARAREDVRVEHQLLVDQGPSITSRDGQLFIGVDNSAIALNSDTTLVDRTHALVNGYATIYELEGDTLVAISTNLPANASRTGSRSVGDTLGGKPYMALLGQCGPTDSSACHQPYSGVVTLHGTDYVDAFEPLSDSSGAFVGALSVAIPVDSVLAPTQQFAVMLLLVALLMALIAILAGSWSIGSLSEKALGALDAQLDVVADASVDLDHLARAQIERAERQVRAARQVNDEVRALNAIARSMDGGQAELRESASEIWGEVSQPGIAPDATSTLRWARQAAVVSGRVGSAAEQARDLCQHIVGLMNHVVAEGKVMSERGHEMRVCAQELRGTVEKVEMTIGERLISRPHGLTTLPVVRRVRSMVGPHAPQTAARPIAAAAAEPRTRRTSGPAPDGADDNQGPRRTGSTGQQPRIGPAYPSRLSGHLNWSGQSGQHRASNTGEWRRAGGPNSLSGDSARWRSPQASRPHRGLGQSGRHPRVPSDPPASPSDRAQMPHFNQPDPPENESSRRWLNPNTNPNVNRWLDDE